MPGPSLTFGFLLATLIGAAFHLIFGGDARRLAVFLLAGWIGFGLGQLFGILFEIDFFSIGSLRLFTAAFGALLALGVVQMLTAGQSRRRT
jgi:hypothetical protein